MQTICKPGDAGYIVPGSKEYCEVIGCSEIATILGFGFEQPKDLWLKKTHRKPQAEHKRIYDRGHDMEPIMARHMRDDYGRIVVSEQVQYRDPERPWLIFHADWMFPKWSPLHEDAKPQAGPGVGEAKAPGGMVAAEMKRDGMSQHYLCQVQGGIHVSSAALGQPIQWATACFLDYNDNYETVAFDVARSDTFIKAMLEKVDAFYDCLVRDVPPEPINPREIPQAPEIAGENAVITEGELVKLAKQWVRIKEVLDEAKASDEVIREQMKVLLDGYKKAEVPGVAKFSYTFGKPTEAIDGAGLLVYLEHVVSEYNHLLMCAGEAGLRGGQEIVFDRSHWVTPKPATRSFRPTPVKEG
jgi:hypothetical protein